MSARKPRPQYNPQNCTVLTQARQAAASGVEMVQALRKLRRALKICKSCVCQAECPARADFNAEVAQAIYEINEEWGLTGPGR
jgi:hypothetical protein